MTLRDKLSGAIAPLFTPFTEAGDVDHESLRRMVRWQHANGSSGVSIGGSTGEPSSQTIAERAAAIDTIADEIKGTGLSFVPGTGSSKLDETLELTAHAKAAGVDAALIITPYYARPTQEALYQWYATVAREFPDLPLIAYNVPSRTAVELAPQTFARLYKDFDNIVGIKETTKDFEHFSRTMFHCGQDVLMWSGIELLCLPLLSLGGVGFISALSNVAPKAVADTYAAGVAGDWGKARELHYGVHPLVDLLFVETNPAPAKWLMAERGLIASGAVRPPLIPLTDEGQAKVRALADEAADYLTDVNL
ncbi:4-hydroxy-tetrahydrodipicolinate synthase [Tessaracoccus oleiagri]|uniref:4-hydroxy-tetrahydrodipicolinate synthase n=1 Tax=Tessaracoccus oleiagri TaxID=686624 RepID=A0A1G9HCV8_9ACTN|nr:4-hydroxy-tetrahydrodipicolinate synthase [Tessaracoccus oleiagri]SDL10685.1 4-hydroxy-tetrahydrodipicolinate synthase [Tessaracoccus oleiagri]